MKTMVKKGAVNVEEQGISNVLECYFGELLSLGPSSQKSVYRILRDYLMSQFCFDYFKMLNFVVKQMPVHAKEKESGEMSQWIDAEVMERIDEICETDVFDSEKSLSALAEILFALHSSWDTMGEEEVKEELDNVLDMPYKLSEMVKESSSISKFYKHSFQSGEIGRLQRNTIHVSGKSLSLSYKVELK
jgi:hypothetical protein